MHKYIVVHFLCTNCIKLPTGCFIRRVQILFDLQTITFGLDNQYTVLVGWHRTALIGNKDRTMYNFIYFFVNSS